MIGIHGGEAAKGNIVLIKYWFEVGQEEQPRRFLSRINDGRKIWKPSAMDLESHRRWYDYSRARDEMMAVTDTELAPWFVVAADGKCRARLNCISHFLSLIPYKAISGEEVKLPKRQEPKGYKEHAREVKRVPSVY